MTTSPRIPTPETTSSVSASHKYPLTLFSDLGKRGRIPCRPVHPTRIAAEDALGVRLEGDSRIAHKQSTRGSTIMICYIFRDFRVCISRPNKGVFHRFHFLRFGVICGPSSSAASLLTSAMGPGRASLLEIFACYVSRGWSG